MAQETISALKALQHYPFTLLDLRAEAEFQKGAFPGSVNLPILRDAERKEVGTLYKNEGQAAAVARGHTLVGPHREKRVANWKQHLESQAIPLLTCWRGGMRSQIAQEWLKMEGVHCLRLEGGYKALRAILLKRLEKSLEGFVITGFTGSGKTKFLGSLSTSRAIDLESLAQHKGSAFGGLFIQEVQPSQQSFENALGLALFRAGQFPLIFEHESKLIGRCLLPKTFFSNFVRLPRIRLECALEKRASRIYEDYVATPLASTPEEEVHQALAQSLFTLRKRLGGLETDRLRAILSQAFLNNDKELHLEWIKDLLTLYYDPLYKYSSEREPAKILFSGDEIECQEWLKKNSDLF